MQLSVGCQMCLDILILEILPLICALMVRMSVLRVVIGLVPCGD